MLRAHYRTSISMFNLSSPHLIFIDLDIKNKWGDSGTNNAIPAAASIAGLSSLGLLRDRMMKRHPKEQEAWMQQEDKRNHHIREAEERRRRGTRNAWSTAAGLGAYAVVSTTNLRTVSERTFDLNRDSGESSYTSTRSTQSPFTDSCRSSPFQFDGAVANAATIDDYGFDSGFSTTFGSKGEGLVSSNNVWQEGEYTSIDTQNNDLLNNNEVFTSSSSFIASSERSDDSAAASSSFDIASEFSRGSYGIYDSKAYPKGQLYSEVSSGFSAPLKEVTPRKGRGFMFGGVTIKNLKSKIESTFAKEKLIEPEQKVQKEKQVSVDKPDPVKSVKMDTLPKVDNKPVIEHIPSSPPPQQLQPETKPELSVIPDKIPMGKDDLSPPKSNGITRSTSLPDRIQMSSDNIITQKQSPPQTLSEPKVILEKIDMKPPLPATTVVPSKTSNIEDNALYTPTTSIDQKKIVEKVSDVFPSSHIYSPEGFYTGLGAGAAVATVAKGFQGINKRKKIIGASPKDVANSGEAPSASDFQSFGDSNKSREPKYSNYNIGNSMDRCNSSLDSISRDLDSMSNDLDSITPEMDFDSVYKDLNSAAQDISSASAVLFAQERYDGDTNTTPKEQHLGSYLDSISQGTLTGGSGQGLTSYLDTLALSSSLALDQASTRPVEVVSSFSSSQPPATNRYGDYDNDSTFNRGSYLESISQSNAAGPCGEGMTSYLSKLTAAAPISFDTFQQNGYNTPSVTQTASNPRAPLPNPSVTSYSKPASEVVLKNGGRRVRVFFDSSVDVKRGVSRN